MKRIQGRERMLENFLRLLEPFDDCSSDLYLCCPDQAMNVIDPTF